MNSLVDFSIVAAFVIYSITVGFMSRKQASKASACVLLVSNLRPLPSEGK